MAGVGILSPTADPSGQGAPEQHYDLNQNMFGGGIAKATEEASAQVFQQALKLKQMDNETQAYQATSTLAINIGQLQDDYRSLPDAQKTVRLREFQDKANNAYQSIANSLPSPSAKQFFLAQGRRYADGAMVSFGTLAHEGAEKANKAAARGMVQTAINTAINNYNLANHESDIDNVTNMASDAADTMNMTGADKVAFVQQQTGTVYRELAQSLINSGRTDEARALLDKAENTFLPGTNDPMLDHRSHTEMLHEISNREQIEASRQEAEARRQEAAQRKAQEDAGKAALDRFTTQMYTDPTKVDITAIANDPSLGKWEPRLKGELIRETQRILKGEDSVQDPSVYRDYLRQINADPGTPGRITDPKELVDALADGKITYKTYGELDRVLNNVRTSELRGDNEAKTIEKFLSIEAGKAASTPEEKNAALLREQDMRKAIKEGLHPKDSKTPPTPIGELIDPRSPKYVGKTPIENYMAPEKDDPFDALLHPAVKSGGGLLGLFGGGGAAPKAFDADTELKGIKSGPAGRDIGMPKLHAAIAAKKLTKAQAKAIALEHGWSSPPALKQPGAVGP